MTKQAIPAVRMAKGYWGNSMRVIKNLIQLQDKRLGGKKLDARVDHYLNEICQLYYQAPPPALFADIRATIVHSLSRTTPSDLIHFLYQNAKRSLDLDRSSSDLRKKTGHLASCSADADSQIHRAEETWWLRGFDPIPRGITFSVILALAKIGRAHV